MATVPVSTVRTRVATALAALPSPWQASPWIAGVFPADPTPDLHRRWAVSVPSSTVQEPRRGWVDTALSGSGSTVRHVRARSSVRVEWCHYVGTEDMVADYSDALADEATVIQAATKLDTTDTSELVLDAVSRRVVGDGAFLLSTADFFIEHLIRVE